MVSSLGHYADDSTLYTFMLFGVKDNEQFDLIFDDFTLKI